MNKSVISALIIALASAILVWVSGYLQLPFWLCLIGMVSFLASPKSELNGLIMTILTVLIGLIIGVIFVQVKSYLPTFQYRQELCVGLCVFVLYLITRVNILNYFSAALLGFAIIILVPENYILVSQSLALGIVCGFITKRLNSLITKENIH